MDRDTGSTGIIEQHARKTQPPMLSEAGFLKFPFLFHM